MSTDQLEISADLALPLEAVTETIAILAKRGKGKTNTAVVLVEELFAVGLPAVVVDPVGVWWGLRSSADGKGEGLPVVIFGGDHGDVPLEASAGEVIADVIVEQRFTAILDLSLLSKTQSRSFMTKFVERLYHRNRDALHVVVDEADAFAPQRAQADGQRLLGAMEDLVRRGRARGLGVTLITQRPAVLHKDVLTQAEVLIALGMTGPRDVAAIDEWVRLHAEEDTARDVKASLPSLPVGTAWVWSPGWLDILQKVKIRARRTFDSSATPRPGEQRRTPATRATVDLQQLGEQITATVEKSKADDPAQLRKRIRELEHQLATRPAPEPEIREVPVISDVALSEFRELARELTSFTTAIGADLQRFLPPRPVPIEPPKPATAVTSAAGGGRDQAGRAAPADRTSPTLPKAQRRVLTVLAQHGSRSTTQVAILTGYSHKSGGFRNALAALRSAGWIDGRGDIVITQAGLEALGAWDPLPAGRDLLEWWKAEHLGKAERAIVDVLVDHHGGPVDVATIAERTGYSASSGGFRNALSRLRSLEIASGRGELALNPELLEAGHA